MTNFCTQCGKDLPPIYTAAQQYIMERYIMKMDQLLDNIRPRVRALTGRRE